MTEPSSFADPISSSSMTAYASLALAITSIVVAGYGTGREKDDVAGTTFQAAIAIMMTGIILFSCAFCVLYNFD